MEEFKVGDVVYCPTSSGSIYKLEGRDRRDYPLIVDGASITIEGKSRSGDKVPSVFKANEKNLHNLRQLYPYLEFDNPKTFYLSVAREYFSTPTGVIPTMCEVHAEGQDWGYDLISGYDKKTRKFYSQLSRKVEYDEAYLCDEKGNLNITKVLYNED